jgi:hypothetical protein
MHDGILTLNAREIDFAGVWIPVEGFQSGPRAVEPADHVPSTGQKLHKRRAD